MRSKLMIALAAVASLAAAPIAASRAEEAKPAVAAAMSQPSKTGYAAANGVNYYYEIHGEGEPLLLLHGGLGSIDMFDPVLPALAAGRQVIAVDLHGHGRTALGGRRIDLAAIGGDLALVLKSLGYEKADVMGYSFGGGAAFRLAVQHPEMVRRLVLISAGFASDGFFSDMRAMQKQLTAEAAPMMKDTPMFKSYAAVAPDPGEFPELVQQMGDLMRQEYNYAGEAKSLKMPVMLVFGDSDMYRPEHMIEFYKLIGGGLKDGGWMRESMAQNRLAIIPNRTHYDLFFAPELVALVLPFLNGETQVKSWDALVEEMK